MSATPETVASGSVYRVTGVDDRPPESLDDFTADATVTVILGAGATPTTPEAPAGATPATSCRRAGAAAGATTRCAGSAGAARVASGPGAAAVARPVGATSR